MLTQKERIRALNDAFRQNMSGGQVLLTPGVNALALDLKAELVRTISAFDQFTGDNDPRGEHDFVNVELAGQAFYAKIDYYDRSMTAGSEDPADPEKTTRVLTIMLAEEY